MHIFFRKIYSNLLYFLSIIVALRKFFCYHFYMNNSEDGKYLIDYQFITSPLVLNGIGLYQIGTKICDSDTFSPPHLHLHWFELTIVRTGKGIISTNGAEELIESGDIYLSFPYDVHSVRSSPDDRLTYSFFSFYFVDEKYKSIFDKFVLSMDAQKSRVFRNSLIPQLVDLLIMEISEGNNAANGAIAEAYKNYAENRLLSLTLEQLVLLIPKLFVYSDISSDNPKTEAQLTFMIMRYLSLNLLSVRNLSEIADYMNYNYSYLSKIFKKQTGKSITEYYLSAKMERAKTLICDERFSISKAAETLGYTSVYSFSKAFKEFYGVSPKNFKNSTSSGDKNAISNGDNNVISGEDKHAMPDKNRR